MTRELELRLRADISGIKSDLEKVSAQLGQLTTQSEKTGSGFADLSKSALALGAAAGAAFIAVPTAANTLVSAFSSTVAAASEAEQAQVKLEAVLRAAGDAAGLSSHDLQAYATQLQSVTGISDESFQNVESLLLTFRNISGDTFKEATLLAADMSAVFGQDLSSSAIQLGKALNDPVQGMTALRRIGVQLSDTQTEQIKSFMSLGDTASAQKVILEELRKEVGGTAEALGGTFSGKVEILKNKFNDLQEKVGASVTQGFEPLLTKLAAWSSSDEALTFTSNLAQGMGELAKAVGGAADAVGGLFHKLQELVNSSPYKVAVFVSGEGLAKGIADKITGFNPFDIEGNLGLGQRNLAGTEGITSTSVEGGDFSRSGGVNRQLIDQRGGMGGRGSLQTVSDIVAQNKATDEEIAKAQRDLWVNEVAPNIKESAKGTHDALKALEEQLRIQKKLEEDIYSANQLMRKAENDAIQAGIEARKKEQEALQQATIGYLNSLGQRNVRFAPGVFEQIAAAGGLKPIGDFDLTDQNGNPIPKVDVVAP